MDSSKIVVSDFATEIGEISLNLIEEIKIQLFLRNFFQFVHGFDVFH